jgi:hypothetical protein
MTHLIVDPELHTVEHGYHLAWRQPLAVMNDVPHLDHEVEAAIISPRIRLGEHGQLIVDIGEREQLIAFG